MSLSRLDLPPLGLSEVVQNCLDYPLEACLKFSGLPLVFRLNPSPAHNFLDFVTTFVIFAILNLAQSLSGVCRFLPFESHLKFA